MKQYAAIDNTVYFWFAGNDTSGSGGDGASPTADVRLAGAAAGAAPVYSPTPSLLSHASYPAGAYEIAIVASAANGFAANNTYAVFCTLAIDSQNPTGFVGSFDLKPVESNITQISDSVQSVTDLKDFADAGYNPANHKILGTADMRGTDNAALASEYTSGRAAYLDNLSAGAVALAAGVDLTKIHGVALTETVNGYLAAAFVKLFDVATPLLIASEVMRGTDSAYIGTPPTVGEIRTEIEGVGTKLTNVLDDTNELQTNQGNWLTATGFSVPNEYDTVITALQTDLDNPSQYMANISALALEATLTDIKGTGFVKDTHSLPQCLTAIGFSIPNEYDTVIAALQTDLNIITGTDGVTLATLQALYAPNKVVPDVAGIAAGLHTTTDTLINGLEDITVADIIAGIADGTYDLQEMMRLILAACVCKSSGGGTTTIKMRDSGDAKDRISATVDDNGNRTAVTLDGS